MELPGQLLKSLEFAKGFNKEAFVKIHQSGEQITSVRINPAKLLVNDLQYSAIPWAEYGYYLAQRPSFTFDPFFHAGTYYVQEASSMFLEQALKQTVNLMQPLKVLDLCAAPGGKSTHIQSLISKESLLVSNEVIRSRANVLKDNIIKWGCENVVVTNNDPKDFAALDNYFDVIVVDAPCSGSGLFRRDAAAIEEWSEANVTLCSQRQQRILADVLPALKENGILIYSTCSYSQQEDEAIGEWLQQKCHMQNVQLSVADEWGIIESAGGYRFWPDKVKGEGFFLACFKKINAADNPVINSKKSVRPPGKLELLSKQEMQTVSKWVKAEGKIFTRYESTVYAWPAVNQPDFNLLLEKLRIVYSGVLVGELMRDKLIPEHALAVSCINTDTTQKVSLTKEQAIQYLQRKDIKLEGASKGWSLACFETHSLGWMNVLLGRVNNYYPKGLRILKEA
jgi:16S rRNA C967 or C1407 C5-methylase (RsmB/RsmF family)/NOL1/NOP2/fmu family ribosome biogenesis protein